MALFGNVTYAALTVPGIYLEDYKVQEHTERGVACIETVLVNASLATQFCRELRGFQSPDGSRQRQASHSEFMGTYYNNIYAFPTCYCTAVDFVPYNGDRGNGLVEAHCRFETLPYELEDSTNAYLSESFEGAASFETVSGKQLFWDAASTQPVDESVPVSVLRPRGVWNLTIHKLPAAAVPTANLAFDFMGTSNQREHYSRKFDRTFAVESLMMLEPRIFQETDSRGVTEYTLQMSIHWDKFGWNKWLREGQTVPQAIYSGGNQWKPYAPADWAGLVPVPVP